MRTTLIAIALVAMAQAAGAQNAQVITGRVLGDSAKPLAGAIVSVTMAPDRTLRQDTTRADGRWRLQFEQASGDYLVHITSPSRTVFRKRVTVPATDSLVVVDATLASSVQQLAAVTVRATRPKPTRENDFMLPDGVSSESVPAGVTGAVPADLAGDLAALAGTMPGLSVTGGGVSAFGLDASQSSTTLNGLSFPGASLPRNAQTSTRFTTSTYDPARGGFAGVETAVSLSPGSINTRRRANVTFDAPMLQVTDRVSRQLGQRVTGGQGSIGGSGAWVEDEWYYNASLDLSRRVSDAASLLDGNASLFSLAGVANDSVNKLLGALSALRIPSSAPGVHRQRVSDKVSFALRVDHAPYLPQSFTANPRTWAVVAIGNINRSAAQGVRLTATPTRGAELTSSYGLLQAIYSAYVTDYSLSETRTGLFVSRSQGAPYLMLPGGSVLVSSQLPDGTSGATSLAFGGDAGFDTRDTQWNWDTRTDYQWFLKPLHRVKVTAGNRVDGYHARAAGNTLGAFGFASLADLVANHPSSFSRTLIEPDRNGAAWSGFVSIGDQWKASPTVQVVYGARVEGNRYVTLSDQNSALERTLGVRTDAAPSRVHVSPRLGFSWRYGANKAGDGGGYNGFGVSGLGTKILGASGLLRGGIGEFRSTLNPQLLSGPGVFTGLAGSARRIACIGQAVPIPDWSAFESDAANIPTSCLGSGSAPLLTDGAPHVEVVDPSFDAPRSWRASLGLMTIVRKIALSVDGNASLNLNQGSSYDVNFAGVQRFIAADEGRPVFASGAAVEPASGLFSTVDSRRSTGFGSVISRRSDLHSLSRQLTISASPEENWGRHMINVAYTLASIRGDVRGFDGAAFGDPRTVEEVRGDLDVRHRFQIQAGKTLPRGFNVTMFVTAASGMPYTPVVSGDVNGDGFGRDRAYVFDPARTSDPALAAGMRSLLASAPSNARDCLLAQLGNPANRNSCQGPWTASASARVALANSQGPWGRRVNASLSITNPLGGLDQALHGGAKLRGWGASVSPDPTLLVVRGFDPAANRFRYDVNPRFGSTRLSQTTVRVPFRATLDISFDLGPSTAQQQLQRVLNRGRGGRPGARLTADSIRLRFSRNVPSVYGMVIREADSLLLSREQVDSLRAANERYTKKVDVIWTKLACELADMSDDYDVARATRMTEDATDAAWEIARLEIPTIKVILTPLQFTLAPGTVKYLAEAKGKVMIRYYMY